MGIRIDNRGDVRLVVVSDRVTIVDAVETLDRLDADEHPAPTIVTDIDPEAVIDLALEDLHTIARRMRGSPRRLRRNAVVVPRGSGFGSIVEDFRTMVSTLSDTWSDGPLELKTFHDRDDAIRWASEPTQ